MSRSRDLSQIRVKTPLLSFFAPLWILAFVAILGTLATVSGCHLFDDPQWEAVVSARAELEASNEELERALAPSTLSTQALNQDVDFVRTVGLLGKVDGLIQNIDTVDANIGSLLDGDIEAIAFIVMMEAAKSAQEDLKAIMDDVKEINDQKKAMRAAMAEVKAHLAELHDALKTKFGSILPKVKAPKLPLDQDQANRTLEAQILLSSSPVSRPARYWSAPIITTGSGQIQASVDCQNAAQKGAPAFVMTLSDLNAQLLETRGDTVGHAGLVQATTGKRALSIAVEILPQAPAQWANCSVRIRYPGSPAQVSKRLIGADAQKLRTDRSALDELTHAAMTELQLAGERPEEGLAQSVVDELMAQLVATRNSLALLDSLGLMVEGSSSFDVLEDLKARLDSLHEMTQESTARLQALMEKRSKVMDLLSNLLAKISDSSNSIVSNLK